MLLDYEILVIKPEFVPYTLVISDFAIENLADMPEIEATRVVELLERVALTGVGSIEWLEGYRFTAFKNSAVSSNTRC